MVKFQHCIILKKSPWHILCLGEYDAKLIIEREKDNVALVLFSEGGLSRQFVETVPQLVAVEQKLIETKECHDIDQIPDEVVEEVRSNIRKKFADATE